MVYRFCIRRSDVWVTICVIAYVKLFRVPARIIRHFPDFQGCSVGRRTTDVKTGITLTLWRKRMAEKQKVHYSSPLENASLAYLQIPQPKQRFWGSSADLLSASFYMASGKLYKPKHGPRIERLVRNLFTPYSQ